MIAALQALRDDIEKGNDEGVKIDCKPRRKAAQMVERAYFCRLGRVQSEPADILHKRKTIGGFLTGVPKIKNRKWPCMVTS